MNWLYCYSLSTLPLRGKYVNYVKHTAGIDYNHYNELNKAYSINVRDSASE